MESSALKSATIDQFGPLPNATFEFASGLNVVVGENGTGKSQLLKLLYAMLKTQVDMRDELTKTSLSKAYANKLVGVFRPDSLGRLVKRRQGRQRCSVKLSMASRKHNSAISFATQATSSVQVDTLPQESPEQSPVYLPTHELLTLAPWFVALYDNYRVDFDETWRDTVSLLGAPSIRGPREKAVAQMIAPLELALGGQVIQDSGTKRFYVKTPGEGQFEVPLVAEGLRKVATLIRLISTGTLLEQGSLFWDEPEANLNPKLISVVAKSIMHMSSHGIQVFIGSHSLFLLRELEILSKQHEFANVKTRYFSLRAAPEGTELEQGDNVDDLKTLVLLDEALYQSDRYLELALEGEGD